MSTLEVNTIAPVSGSSDVTLGGSSKNIKFASGTTVDFNTNTPSLTLGGDMKMTPSFYASLSANQSVSSATWTKVQVNTELFDTDSAYDNSSNYRFTPQVAGKYYIGANVTGGAGSGTGAGLYSAIYKNGSSVRETYYNSYATYSLNRMGVILSSILDLNGSSDYVEIFGYVDNNTGSATFNGGSSHKCVFFGYKIIGA